MYVLGRISKNNHLMYTFVYNVKNTQANVAKVKVLEQIPLSSDDKLKVCNDYDINISITIILKLMMHEYIVILTFRL